jgi:hypothetical protein
MFATNRRRASNPGWRIGPSPGATTVAAMQRQFRSALEFGMRVAALFDIHGNLPALEAVLAEVRAIGVDRVVIGGDVVPGPMPRECLDVVLELGIPTDFVIGNGDRETIAARRGFMSAEIPGPSAKPWPGMARN